MLLGFLSSPTVDTATIISLVKGVMTLFTEFPLNIFIGAGLACVGFKVFKRGKAAAN